MNRGDGEWDIDTNPSIVIKQFKHAGKPLLAPHEILLVGHGINVAIVFDAHIVWG